MAIQRLKLTSDCGRVVIDAELKSMQDGIGQDAQYKGSYWSVKITDGGERVSGFMSADNRVWIDRRMFTGETATKTDILFMAIVSNRFNQALQNVDCKKVINQWHARYATTR